ncbi:alpha/beta fold hydrolase [Castellaniella defragrans]|uniref:AB hydrolase-1 domain-containing protein n=1 Tax=Castellaniella defragrans (strain DSM 12143 / CCUG 39792 / 65Phen) TaxID=1437824 RepID=W8WZB4_CASD6|nr:alpha/beta fold hydrolase [Castellaniella defragrans]CDM24949.1 hypothetical protein BN940_12491 [Castellaniella defragrans 65Phen]
MTQSLRLVLALLAAGIALAVSGGARAQAPAPKIGVVVMHGKAGSPSRHVAELAAALEAKGCLVANLEMPWSGRRNYDVGVAAAEREVAAALDALRARGAQKLFVGGHSQGGHFALYLGGRLPVDGVIAIAPGGNSNSPQAREQVSEAVALARKRVGEGRGETRTRLVDYEGARGAYPVAVAPAVYLDWFAPDGPLNRVKPEHALSPAVPVLFIVPTRDYPGLLKARQQRFAALPPNPRTELYQPEASHTGAPSASIDRIAEWMAAVAEAR